MADQWMGMLKDIPPGTDIFDFVKGMLTDQMFPDFGTVRTFIIFLVALNSTDVFDFGGSTTKRLIPS